MIYAMIWVKTKVIVTKPWFKSLDEIPYGEMPKWVRRARFLIIQGRNSE